jgi:ribosome biogenesis GTPase
LRGTVEKSLSGFYYLRPDGGGAVVRCTAKGTLRQAEFESPLVGDRAEFEIRGKTALLTELLPRSNSFIRPPVANIGTLVIVASAASPAADPFLIDRMTVQAESVGAEPVICFTKLDLARSGLAETYRAAGFQTPEVSSETGEGIAALAELLAGAGVCALTGNSGAGKTSLLNALGLDLPTGEVSDRLGRGRHTTRHVELHTVNHRAGTLRIIDTPGFSSFETVTETVPANELAENFRDFAPHLGKCRYRDCIHRAEPDCAVTRAVASGGIAAARYESYLRLLASAEEKAAAKYR